jgi:nucleotide-sensitive chloride channel 1A
VNSDDDFETLDLNLIPTESPAPTEGSNGTSETPNPAKSIFEALSACADLHPDPESGEEEEGEDTAPGEGGWITSENMDQMMDADGNFVGFGTLGAGAGTIRTRDEDMEDAEEDGAEVDDTKWRRTQ